jgi:hypothetical protein
VCQQSSTLRRIRTPFLSLQSMTSHLSPANNDRCPHCEGEVKSDPVDIFGDKPCPNCDKRLWFLTAADSARFFDYDAAVDLRKQAVDIIAERFNLDVKELAENPKLLQELDTDSLEALELIMDLEEQLGLV